MGAISLGFCRIRARWGLRLRFAMLLVPIDFSIFFTATGVEHPVLGCFAEQRLGNHILVCLTVSQANPSLVPYSTAEHSPDPWSPGRVWRLRWPDG